MHYIKRINTKKYQTGGLVGDIFVPNGGNNNKLEGIDVPKVDFSNYAIDIKTTGFLDRMQKVEEMEMKRKRLEFDYAELEFKQGKEYMDFAAKMITSIRGDVQKTNEAGGIADLNETYRAAIDNHNNRLNKVGADMTKAFMTQQFPQGMQMMSEFSKAPDANYLKANTFGKLLNNTYANLTKLNAGVTTAKSYDKLLQVAGTKFNNMDEAMAALLPVVSEVNQAIALGIEMEDVDKFTDGLFDISKLGQREITKIIDGPDGRPVSVTEKSEALMPFNDYLENALNSAMTDTVGSAFLDQNGINPRDRVAAKTFLEPILKRKYDAMSKVKAVEINEGLTSNLWDTQDKANIDLQRQIGAAEGAKEKAKDKVTGGSSGGKKTEAQTTTEAITRAANERYGTNKFTTDMIRAIEGTVDKKDINTSIDELAKRLGLQAVGGGAEMSEEDLSNVDAIPINTLEDLTEKYGIIFNPENTTIINGFVVTNDKDVVSAIGKKFRRVIKKSSKFDADIEKITGGKWDSSAWDALPGGNDIETHVFPIKAIQAPKKDNRGVVPRSGFTEIKLEGGENPQDSSTFNQMFNINK